MAYKLLLADDSITIQKVVELTLSEEDFDVTAVGDGESALEAAKKLAPDIILADVFMPKLDGYQLCAKIRQEQSLKGVPVVLLAGTFEDYDEGLAAKVGADDHLTKPFESADLVSMCKRLVERRPAEAGMFAEPVEEAEFAAPAVEEAQGAPDDLWSVVDMASDSQPLSGATEILSEDDLWKRANLFAEPEPQAEPAVEEAIPWEDITAEPVAEEEAEAVEFAEAEPEFEPEEAVFAAEEAEEAEATAILDMDMLGASFVRPAPEPEPVSRPAYAPPEPEMIREQVAKAVREVIDQKVREAVSELGREAIERIIWEVVPDLAEEIIVKEMEKLKAGID